MKSAREWTKLIRDDVDLRLAKSETPERVDDLIADWLAAIQADAAADMRERAAKACEGHWRTRRGEVIHDEAQRAGDSCAADIRALPLEES
jgi:hypothetical protein